MDSMKALENRTIDNKVEMDVLDALDEIRAINQRHERIDTSGTTDHTYIHTYHTYIHTYIHDRFCFYIRPSYILPVHNTTNIFTLCMYCMCC